MKLTKRCNKSANGTNIRKHCLKLAFFLQLLLPPLLQVGNSLSASGETTFLPHESFKRFDNKNRTNMPYAYGLEAECHGDIDA